MLPLVDQSARDRFVAEHARNFSVLAPAGVGKTTSIVNRIVALAEQAAREGQSLRDLVVVTYTRQAADEMYQRAKYALVERGSGPRALGELGQAFFGTIHSFCLRLVQLHGWRLNLPAQLEMEAESEELWETFRREVAGLLEPAPEAWRAPLAALGAVSEVFGLAPKLPPEVLALSPDPVAALQQLGAPPPVDLQEVMAAGGRGKKETQEAYKQQLRAWREGWLELLAHPETPPGEAPSLPLPEVSSGGSEIVGAARAACAPLQGWYTEAVFQLAVLLARRFQAFKLARGRASFDDAISLAFRLVRHPETVKEIRQQGLRVLLDEAQDTDPLQFRILTEITRAPDATDCWADGAGQGPRAGFFCMVGDPQQSIYSDRADLGFYRALHRRLLDDGGEELRFEVTMRCQQTVVDSLNALLPLVLAGGDEPGSQVPYITLHARPDADEGQVVRLELAAPEDEKPDLERDYARALVDRLEGVGLEAWRARSWSQVAILCPRNEWLTPLSRELKHRGLPVQLLTTRLQRRDQPAWAWTVAALEVLADPDNAFEMYGLLREILGFSDDAIATYTRRFRRNGTWPAVHPLSLQAPQPWIGHPVGKVLEALRQRWQELEEAPLYVRVRRWLEGLQLVERLASLPESVAGEAEAVVQAILRQSAEAEEQRVTLPEWVAKLRSWVERTAVEAGEELTACNLLTCFKAKGLGWDAVVLPYFFRPIGFMEDRFPRVLWDSREGAQVALTKHWQPDNWKDDKNLRRERELERLLYVACTRARQTLVFVDDEAWMKKPDRSLGALLRVPLGGENRKLWQALPTELAAVAEAAPPRVAPTPAPELPEVSFELEQARAAAAEGWQRTLPSSLAHHAAPEETRRERRVANDFDEETATVPFDPTAYGNWWHETMEHTPWEQAREAWRAHWEGCLPACPDAERGQRELELLEQSDFATLLGDRPRQVRCEVPFLDPADGGIAMEGIIDWLGWLEEPDELLLVDWKTDLTAGEGSDLIERYGPQIRAYLAGLQRHGGAALHACVYSTRLGRLMKVQ
ncbi:MAG: UvrD-helicase domain-containing protein [Verrucomicrobiota bacterium JB022]|nr:UvrD-helicase domain-containing protein [Verrucomicrobiota bacterium JB022]